MLLMSSADFFFKIFKKFFQEHYQRVKQFGSRSGPTFCWSWSWSKLFANAFSRSQKSQLARKELKLTLWACIFVCLVWLFTSHQHSFSYVGMGLPRLNQYLARINVSYSRTQPSDTGEAPTRSPSVLSQALSLGSLSRWAKKGGLRLRWANNAFLTLQVLSLPQVAMMSIVGCISME